MTSDHPVTLNDSNPLLCHPERFHELEQCGLSGTAQCLTLSPELNSRTRLVLVEWLIAVHENFRSNQQTLSLTIAILDAYLQRAIVTREEFQLLGMTCLLLANKVEEVFCCEIKDLIHACDSAYTETDILRMERQVCTVLNFHLVLPTRWRAHEYYVNVFGDLNELWYCRFLIEYSYLNPELNRYYPSVVATTAVVLAKSLFRGSGSLIESSEWSPFAVFKIPPETLLRCVKDLLHTVRRLRDNTILRERWSHEKMHGVYNGIYLRLDLLNVEAQSQDSSQLDDQPFQIRNLGTLVNFESYRKGELIEDGLLGTVYKGWHIPTNTAVALKKAKNRFDRDLPDIALREIAIYQQITLWGGHPHIVNSQGVGLQKDRIWLILEYLPRDLTTALKRGLTNELRQRFSLQLTQAVTWLHDRGIIHRDIKPRNILITVDDNLKLVDFDHSRSGIVQSRASTPEVCTRWYRPPEVLLRDIIYTSRIDCWSLGCIVSEIYTGEVLFEQDTESLMLRDIYQRFGVPTEETWPGVTELWNWKVSPQKVKYRPFVYSDYPEPICTYLRKSLVLCPGRRANSAELVQILESAIVK